MADSLSTTQVILRPSKPEWARYRILGRVVLARLEVLVILAALISAPLTIVEVNGQNGLSFQVADWTIWAVFAIEYAFAQALAESRRLQTHIAVLTREPTCRAGTRTVTGHLVA